MSRRDSKRPGNGSEGGRSAVAEAVRARFAAAWESAILGRSAPPVLAEVLRAIPAADLPDFEPELSRLDAESWLKVRASDPDLANGPAEAIAMAPAAEPGATLTFTPGGRSGPEGDGRPGESDPGLAPAPAPTVAFSPATLEGLEAIHEADGTDQTLADGSSGSGARAPADFAIGRPDDVRGDMTPVTVVDPKNQEDDGPGPAETVFEDARPRGQGGGPKPAGPTVAGYEILGELGRGGMGVVYKARQTGLHRLVALKMILAGDHAGEEQLARFHTEAEAVAALQHPNIVQIFDVGERGGLPFFSLEFLDGGNLAEVIDGKPQVPEQAGVIIRTLAEAMHFAHQHQVIHRDLKPANVLLAGDGTPKITDFGLAKKLEADSRRTRTGTLMGTPSYMAPEAARGDTHDIGPLVDLYALGAMLYELLTGRPPFQGATPLDTLDQVRTQDPVPPTRLQPKVPRDLETICLKCLEKDPARRYADCGALAEDLRRFAEGEPIRARPVSFPERVWRWCRRNRRVAALAAAVLLLLTTLAVGSTVAAFRINREKNRAQREWTRAEDEARAAERARSLEERARLAADRARAEEEKSRALAERNAEEAREARAKADENARIASEQRGLALDAFGQLVNGVQDKLEDKPSTQELKQDLLRTALEGLRKVARSSGANDTTDRTMAQAHMRMGGVFMKLLAPKDAREQQRQAHAIYEARTRESPSDPSPQLDLASSFDRLGDFDLLLGNRVPAKEEYLKALEIRRGLKDKVRGGAYLSAMAMSSTKLGRLSEPAEAVKYYDEARAIRQQLARDGTPPSRQNLFRVTLLLAEALEQAGDHDAALARVGEAELLARRNIEQDPGARKYKIDLARANDALGGLKSRMDEPAAARESYGRAIAILRPIAEDDRRDAEIQMLLALALARAGLHAEAATQSEVLRMLAPESSGNLYNVACCYAQANAAVVAATGPEGPTPEQAALRRRYADTAVATLREALAIKPFEDLDHLRHDPDLDSIRQDPAFADFLRDAERKSADADAGPGG